MDNSTLSSTLENNNVNLTTLISVISSIGGILTIITGYLLKAHIQQSSCYGGRCCTIDCVDKEEEKVIKQTLKRYKTEKKRRESEVITIDNVSVV